MSSILSTSRVMVFNQVKRIWFSSKSRILHSSNNKSNNLTPSQLSKTKLELEEKFVIYLKNLIFSVNAEKETVLARERLLNSNLPEYLQELRSLSIFNLKIATDFSTLCSSSIDFKLKLVRTKAGHCLPSGGWRKGMLVSLQVEDADESQWRSGELEPWMKVSGILEDVQSTFLVVSLDNLTGWVLEHLRGRPTSESQNIRIVKRSEEKLYSNSIKQLKDLLKKNGGLLDRSDPGKLIMASILGVDTEETEEAAETEGRRRDVLTVYNPALLRDEIKMSALTLCSERRPLTLLHGPPGTGKTTTLAAAVLSAVKNGDRVLVVAPSHAACDTLVASLTHHCPGLSLVRLGNKLRLTQPELETFLPENIQPSPGLENIAARLSWVRGAMLDGQRGRGELLEEEGRLVEQYRREYRDHEERLVKEVKIVVCTLQTSYRPSLLSLLRHHFDLVCVDEAGFSLDSHALPVLLRARRLILAGDHLQLPPVVLSAEARDRGLAVSLFERLASSPPLQSCLALLSVQYRSNKIISGWSSQQFYNNLLTANSSNAEHTLSQMVGRRTLSEYQDEAWLLSSPMVWLDTKDKDWEEDVEDEESISNIGEAVMVANVVTVLIKIFGVSQHDIGMSS